MHVGVAPSFPFMDRSAASAFDRLNDDCVQEILEFLPDFCDLLLCRLTSWRFHRGVSGTIVFQYGRDVETMNSGVPSWRWGANRAAFSLAVVSAGTRLSQLTVTLGDRQRLSMLPLLCSNLAVLDVTTSKRFTTVQWELFPRLEALTVRTAVQCSAREIASIVKQFPPATMKRIWFDLADKSQTGAGMASRAPSDAMYGDFAPHRESMESLGLMFHASISGWAADRSHVWPALTSLALGAHGLQGLQAVLAFVVQCPNLESLSIGATEVTEEDNVRPDVVSFLPGTPALTRLDVFHLSKPVAMALWPSILTLLSASLRHIDYGTFESRKPQRESRDLVKPRDSLMELVQTTPSLQRLLVPTMGRRW